MTHLVEQQANYERSSNCQAMPQSRKLDAKQYAQDKQKPSRIVHPERNHKSVHAYTFAQPPVRCATSLFRPVLFPNFPLAPRFGINGETQDTAHAAALEMPRIDLFDSTAYNNAISELANFCMYICARIIPLCGRSIDAGESAWRLGSCRLTGNTEIQICALSSHGRIGDHTPATVLQNVLPTSPFVKPDGAGGRETNHEVAIESWVVNFPLCSQNRRCLHDGTEPSERP